MQNLFAGPTIRVGFFLFIYLLFKNKFFIIIIGERKMANKIVFDFEDENSTIEAVGIKGMNLNRMVKLELPVPSGFTLSTEASKKYFKDGALSDNTLEQIWRGLKDVERKMRIGFGDFERPLLLSVRTGASVKMLGLAPAVLNVGINDEIASNIVKNSKSKTFAWELYRRLLLPDIHRRINENRQRNFVKCRKNHSHQIC